MSEKPRDRNELKCPITVNGYVVPCGKCNSCLKVRKNNWTFRLAWELKNARNAWFVTLTYDEKNVPYNSDGKVKIRSLRREDLIRFHKSVREAIRKKHIELGCEQPDYGMRYYSVGEYGTKTRRPHYHLLMFNVHDEVVKRFDRIWNKGFIKVGDVNNKSIAYTTKYMIDYDVRMNNTCAEQPFSIMSKNLGLNYLQSNKDFHKTADDKPEDWRTFVYHNGYKQSLPRYYKNRIFDLAELELISEMNAERIALKHIEEMKELEKTKQDTYKHKQAMREHKDLTIKMKSQLKNTL